MKTIVLATSIFATMGCSTLPRHPVRNVTAAGADIRGETAVRGRRPKAIVSGPVLVKHLDTEGSGVVIVYLMDDPGVGDRACPSADTEGVSALAVLQGRSQITDLRVPEGKRVCATVAEAPAATISWHAQAAVVSAGGARELALVGR
jgi:hypothetical protein